MNEQATRRNTQSNGKKCGKARERRGRRACKLDRVCYDFSCKYERASVCHGFSLILAFCCYNLGVGARRELVIHGLQVMDTPALLLLAREAAPEATF